VRRPTEDLNSFLRGLLQDLQRRCVLLRDRLAALDADADVRDHALSAYADVERLRRATDQLLADPGLGTPALLPNHLQLYKRLHEGVDFVESYPLPFVERYSERDRRLTHLCQRLAVQIQWPLPTPLIGAFSTQYYWTFAPFSVICVPAVESETLLGLPDLCHELGHLLLTRYEGELVGDFVTELAQYIAGLQRRAVTQQLPPDYRRLYDHLFAAWRDAWLWEFVSDMVATYLVGPAFAWQHLRLCAAGSRSVHYPALGESAEHPADEARLRGVLAALQEMRAVPGAQRVNALWTSYLAIDGIVEPPEYAVCYPQVLIDSLARRVIEGCRTLDLVRFDHAPQSARDTAITVLFQDAWERFLADPVAFASWEDGRLIDLWSELGV
jgi:hypothetical protein